MLKLLASYRQLLVPLTAVLLVACTTPGDPVSETADSRQVSASTFFFECDDQSSFVARVESSHAWLFLENITVNLPRRPSASGVKYEGVEYLFWSKGDEALLETPGKKHLNCKNNRAKAIWEAAKLDGADFRAIGNEPGWTLLLSADLLVLDADYGTNHYEFKTPEPDVDVEARLTRYQVPGNGQDFLLELTGQPCYDTMSGEAFPTRVRIQLNGKWLHGCGRPLH